MILVLGIGGATIPIGNFALGGIGLAGVVGVLLNLILPRGEEGPSAGSVRRGGLSPSTSKRPKVRSAPRPGSQRGRDQAAAVRFARAGLQAPEREVDQGENGERDGRGPGGQAPAGRS